MLLYLVRHASAEVDSAAPPAEWRLHSAGVEEARALGSHAEGWHLRSLYTSTESKARETAAIISRQLEINLQESPAFAELPMHGWFPDPQSFDAAVRSVLESPPGVGDKSETRERAAERFSAGVRNIPADAFPAAIVSHGR